MEKTVERQEKNTFVSALRSELEDAGIVIVTRQSGLTVSQSTALRSQMREVDATYKVAKNTLSRIAIKGLSCEIILDYLSGPTAISYAQDPVAAAKVISKFAKANDKLEIVGGSFGGKKLSAAEIVQLGQLPSMDELRGTLIGLIQAPATKLARLTLEPAAQLARLCSAYANKS